MIMQNIHPAIVPNISILFDNAENIRYQFLKVLDCAPVV